MKEEKKCAYPNIENSKNVPLKITIYMIKKYL
jgi:hypothetical protein